MISAFFKIDNFFNVCEEIEFLVSMVIETSDLKGTEPLGWIDNFLNSDRETVSRLEDFCKNRLRFFGLSILAKNGLPLPRTKLDWSSPPIQLICTCAESNFFLKKEDIFPSTLSIFSNPVKLQLWQPIPLHFSHDFSFWDIFRIFLLYLPYTNIGFDLILHDSSLKLICKNMSGCSLTLLDFVFLTIFFANSLEILNFKFSMPFILNFDFR